MSWKTKQSANTKLEIRDEPYLTPALIEKITKDIMPRYATNKGALMTTLHEVQHVYGYIPWQAMVEISKVLVISAAEVADVVSFYEDYHSEPMGKNIVGICQSIACEVCGHQALIDHLKDRLGVEVHETSGTVSLPCLVWSVLARVTWHLVLLLTANNTTTFLFLWWMN